MISIYYVQHKIVCDLSRCTARQRKWQKNTIGLHCWISHSRPRGILYGIHVAVAYVTNRKLTIFEMRSALGLIPPKTYVDVPDLKKWTFSIVNFHFHPITHLPVYTRKAPNFPKSRAFYKDCKMAPNLCNLDSLVSDKNPPIKKKKKKKKHPKRQAHIRIPCQCENPPAFGSPGNVSHPVVFRNKNLYFRGALILDLVINYLVQSAGMKDAQRVILYGYSGRYHW